LVHAADTGVLDHEVLAHPVTLAQLHHEVAAPAAARTGRYVI
jgi:hypothetical protein